MKNYIHIFKHNKEIAVINDIKDLRKYRDADYYFYESKTDYKINKHSKAYMYPTEYSKFKSQLKYIADYLYKNCKNCTVVDLNDMNRNGIETKEIGDFNRIFRTRQHEAAVFIYR